MVLRAEATGRTYRIQSVDGDTVKVSRLRPLPRGQLEADIERGAIEVVGR
jgi:hypothetical protein